MSESDQVRAIQIRAQIGAIKLEKLGMRRRGQSLSAMLKQKYELPKSASYDQVLEKLQADFDALVPPTSTN